MIIIVWFNQKVKTRKDAVYVISALIFLVSAVVSTTAVQVQQVGW